jgi:hypothetical protein
MRQSAENGFYLAIVRNEAHFGVMARKKTRQSTLSYANVEKTLMRVFDIDEGDLLSFRGRIRHLRTLNVPRDMPKPGSGRQIWLDNNQVLQIAFAILLEQYGVTPRLAADLGPRLAASLHVRWVRPDVEDLYAVFRRATQPREQGSTMMEIPDLDFVLLPGFDELQLWLKKQFVDFKKDAQLVLNITNLMRRVEQALKEGGE